MKKVFFAFLGLTISLSLFFTACQKTTDNVALTNNIELKPYQRLANEMDGITFLIPDHIEKTEESIAKFEESLTLEEVKEKIETYKVFMFLEATNNLEKLRDENPNFDQLTIEDVKRYAPKQVNDYPLFKMEPTTNKRGCKVVSSYCSGTSLCVTKKCCKWVFWCHYVHEVIPNHPSCLPAVNPCQGVVCPTGYSCANGNCIKKFCSPKCPIGTVCNPANNECIPL